MIGGGEIIKEIFGGDGFNEVHAAGALLTDSNGGNKISAILGILQHGFIVTEAGVMIDVRVGNSLNNVHIDFIRHGCDMTVVIKLIGGSEFDFEDMVNEHSPEKDADIVFFFTGKILIGAVTVEDKGFDIIRVIVGEECGDGEEKRSIVSIDGNTFLSVEVILEFRDKGGFIFGVKAGQLTVDAGDVGKNSRDTGAGFFQLTVKVFNRAPEIRFTAVNGTFEEGFNRFIYGSGGQIGFVIKRLRHPGEGFRASIRGGEGAEVSEFIGGEGVILEEPGQQAGHGRGNTLVKNTTVEAAVALELDDGDTGGCILINFVLIREISANILDFLDGIGDGGFIGDKEQKGFIRVSGRLEAGIIAKDGKGFACGEAGVDRAGQSLGENYFESGAAGGVILPCDGGRHSVENIGVIGEWHGDSFFLSD